jgi:hypothetical protein
MSLEKPEQKSLAVCSDYAIQPQQNALHTFLEEPMNRRSLLANTFALVVEVFFLLLMTTVTAWGQAGTSTVRGIVKVPQQIFRGP